MDTNVYRMMNSGSPLKSYIKRSLGKLQVKVWDEFTGTASVALLVGDPRKPDDGCIVDVYSEKEDVFFKKANAKHFQTGDLVEHVRKEKEETEEEKLNRMSSDEMRNLLSKPFLAIQNAVAKFTSVVPLFAMLDVAREMGKSEKITKLIESKIAFLQASEYGNSGTEEYSKE